MICVVLDTHLKDILLFVFRAEDDVPSVTLRRYFFFVEFLTPHVEQTLIAIANALIGIKTDT
jgi:hypothetical protein